MLISQISLLGAAGLQREAFSTIPLPSIIDEIEAIMMKPYGIGGKKVLPSVSDSC